MPLANVGESWLELLWVSVLAAQGVHRDCKNRLVWDGKEKVYGSIP
jgi:hypothetical protein